MFTVFSFGRACAAVRFAKTDSSDWPGTWLAPRHAAAIYLIRLSARQNLPFSTAQSGSQGEDGERCGPTRDQRDDRRLRDSKSRRAEIQQCSLRSPHGRPHIGANGVSWSPWKIDEKLKSENMQKEQFFKIQIYFRMHHFVVKFSKKIHLRRQGGIIIIIIIKRRD